MFERKFAGRDRYKSRRTNRTLYYRARGSIESLIAFKTERAAPVDDIGRDPVDVFALSKDLNEYYMLWINQEVWDRYTKPQPFCTVPEGGTDPKKRGGKMERKDPTWRGFMSALKQTAKDKRKAGEKDEAKAFEAKWLGDGPEPPMPTQAQIVAKAGGRVVNI